MVENQRNSCFLDLENAIEAHLKSFVSFFMIQDFGGEFKFWVYLSLLMLKAIIGLAGIWLTFDIFLIYHVYIYFILKLI